jgi:SAM-dependent methyltransferase
VTEADFLTSTRASYDAIAADYAGLIDGGHVHKPWDNAVLTGFADIVRATGAGPVADVGCGPGHVTAYLHSVGVDAFGVDLSAGMVATAQRTHPGLSFREGSMTALDLPDGSLGGVVAWYSTIHIPPDLLGQVCSEFHRVLAEGGHALLAFQVGDEVLHRTEGFGHAISLTSYRREPDRVADALRQAGLVVRATLLREPDEYPTHVEKTQQAYLLARKV